ncbi:hypothetical protein JVU11DRAFT_6666 [Chiua virens]|nr:hypothetical protein JVU11DRAFT_6666 [Chiua virens]
MPRLRGVNQSRFRPVSCSIAGIGFVFWAIHAIRKMRNDPFKYQKEPDHGLDSSAFDHSILVQHGVAQSPSYPDRVRTRLALSQPEEEFYTFTTPTSIEAYTDQTPIDTPEALRRPPPAGGQSLSSRSHRSGRHGSLVRAGADGERYGYGTQDDYIRDAGPSRARGSPLHEPGRL